MTFIKYTRDGKAVIQPSALTLSSLDAEKKLEMHTLNKAIVLLKDRMTAEDKLTTINELLRLANSLAVSVAANLKDEQEFQFPYEAVIDAGLDGCELEVFADDGIVMIVGDHESVNLSSWTVRELARHGLPLDLFAKLVSDIHEELEEEMDEYYSD